MKEKGWKSDDMVCVYKTVREFEPCKWKRQKHQWWEKSQECEV
jgi:hypothetical protein